MNIANRILIGSAALIISGSAFAAGNAASFSPATQADWDSAHRDVASFNINVNKEQATQVAAKTDKDAKPAKAEKTNQSGTN